CSSDLICHVFCPCGRTIEAAYLLMTRCRTQQCHWTRQKTWHMPAPSRKPLALPRTWPVRSTPSETNRKVAPAGCLRERIGRTRVARTPHWKTCCQMSVVALREAHRANRRRVRGGPRRPEFFHDTVPGTGTAA